MTIEQDRKERFIWLPGDIEIVTPPPALKAASALSLINAAYHDLITEALTTFFEGGSMAGPKNQFKRSMIEAFGSAFDTGYQDGGGDMPPDADALAWLNSRVEQELAYIDGVFIQAKQLRKEGDADTFTWTTERASGYTRSAADVYNNGKIYGMGNRMLTFDGPDGQPDNICQKNNGTCVKLKGQRHKASWWVSHGLVPYRGNSNYDCGAWECQHYLRDDQGNQVTI